MPTVNRIFNFAAGPAVLPLPVLEEAQRDLLMLPGVGMSVLEISHRSAAFDEIIAGAERDLRALAGIPGNYQVLFLQGGASLQFSMVPMNLLPPGGSADYIVSGVWSEKAVKEAKRVGTVNIAATTAAENFTRVPGRTSSSSRRAPPTRISPPTTRFMAPSGRRCRRSAVCRSCATPPRTSSAGRSTSRNTA